jgi:hypothetical protein
MRSIDGGHIAGIAWSLVGSRRQYTGSVVSTARLLRGAVVCHRIGTGLGAGTTGKKQAQAQENRQKCSWYLSQFHGALLIYIFSIKPIIKDSFANENEKTEINKNMLK